MLNFCRLVLIFYIVLLGFATAIESNKAHAQGNVDIFHSSGLPIPRFVALRSDKVFVRTGPALRYPIQWIYQKKHYPVEVIQEFDTWRKIRDIDGEEGWIHQSLLSGKKMGLVNAAQGAYLYRKPIKIDKNNNPVAQKPMALLENKLLIHINKCLPQWCFIDIGDLNGWIES